MAKQKSVKRQYALPKSFWYILAVIVVLAIGSLGWLLFWRTGRPDYIGALNKCNGRPPVVANSFITSTYTRPSDASYKIPVKAGAIDHVYFCSEKEAISAGYKHASN